MSQEARERMGLTEPSAGERELRTRMLDQQRALNRALAEAARRHRRGHPLPVAVDPARLYPVLLPAGEEARAIDPDAPSPTPALREVLCLRCEYGFQVLNRADLTRHGHEPMLRGRALDNLAALPAEGQLILKVRDGYWHHVSAVSPLTSSHLLELPHYYERFSGGKKLPPEGALVVVPAPQQILLSSLERPFSYHILPDLAEYEPSQWGQPLDPLSPHVYWWLDGRLIEVTKRRENGELRVDLPDDLRYLIDRLVAPPDVRLMHYQFGHRTIPDLAVEAEGKREEVFSKEFGLGLLGLWRSEHGRPQYAPNPLPVDGLRAELAWLDNRHRLLLFAFPKPLHDKEVFFTALARRDGVGELRYFLLEHNVVDGEQKPRLTERRLGSWEEVELRVGVKATKRAFFNAIALQFLTERGPGRLLRRFFR
ncbi:hypothetical protein [Streptantibioticus cattleyicolor]|nr:protein of unknown function [Streptantibioticus cattleyicolor NRRL 8057 = DSM 46488]